jgi:hypothetical protein
MRFSFVLTLAFVACLAAFAHADKWAPPTPRVFASPSGSYGFKVLKPQFGSTSEGMLFRLDGEGKEEVIWQGQLINTPQRVLVDDDGKSLVTIDTYGRLGFAHSVVVYGEKGKLIRDFELEDLLTKEEIEGKVARSVSSRHWTDGADLKIENSHFVARLAWGKTLRIELASGKIVESATATADDIKAGGLIGTAEKDGEATRIAYHYPHGKVFPPALIRNQFHDGEVNRPGVKIELVGYVEVPEVTQVDIFHAAGGVNEDHGTLYIDNRQIGQVGDDTVKNVIYTLALPKGTHPVRWVLTGGTFQANLLKFQDVKTGELLRVFHTAKQRAETGADKAVKTIDAQGELAGWPPDFKTWTRVSTDAP